MSHNVTVSDIKITDISALEQAVQELKSKGVNVSLEKDAYYRGYNEQQSGEYPYVLKLHNARFDVAFAPDSEGNYAPVCDPWGGHVRKEIGVLDSSELTDSFKACSINSPEASIGRLMQTYGVVKAEREAANQGLSAQRVQGDDGCVSLVVSGY